MPKQSQQRLALGVASAVLFALSACPAPADVITLDTGTVHGKLVATGNSKTVGLITPSGSLLVFDRQDVKSVKRGTVPKQKAAAKVAKAKTQLTPEQKAWMTKIRKLADRAASPDRNVSRKAATELAQITDPDALPALHQYLAASRNEDLRLLYTIVLRNVPGPKAAYGLVLQSLLDRSSRIREAARKAISASDRGNLARPWYIQALKLGRRNLASLAAEGIAEIGDPDGESIPYLIAALTFQSAQVVATAAGRVLDAETLLEIQYQHQLNGQPVGPQPTASVIPRVTVGGGIPAGANGVLVGHGYVGPPLTGPTVIYPDGWRGGYTGQPQPYLTSGLKDTGWPDIATVSTPVTMQDIANTAVRYSKGVDVQTNVNPGVYDALLKLTGQDLGDNVVAWQRWWASEKKNRDLENHKAEDRVISRPASPHDTPVSR